MQPKLDWIPMIEHMIEYKGMLSTFPDIIHVQKVSLRGSSTLLYPCIPIPIP